MCNTELSVLQFWQRKIRVYFIMRYRNISIIWKQDTILGDFISADCYRTINRHIEVTI